VEIFFKSSSLAKSCGEWEKAVRKYGRGDAALIAQRLEEMRASANLAVLMKVPGARCHQLSGDRKNYFAVNLNHPYRMIFEPANNPLPRKKDGGIDLEEVTAVTILRVKVDYHGGKGRGKK
jgi:plasmid maintenance system killer protein